MKLPAKNLLCPAVAAQHGATSATRCFPTGSRPSSRELPLLRCPCGPRPPPRPVRPPADMPSEPLAARVRALAEAAASKHRADARAAAQEALSANLRAEARFRVEVRGDSRAAAALYPPSWAAAEPGAASRDWAGVDSCVPRGATAPGCCVEAARAALARVAANSARKKTGRGGKYEPVVHQLTEATPVPRFDAWVPVNKEFWISNEFMVQPYMPWFGDEEGERGNAYNVYRKMASEGGDDDSALSDGELDADGNFVEPDGDEAWYEYDSLREQTRRAAARAAIIAVYSNHDRDDPAVANATAAALKLRSRRHVHKILDLAEARAAAAAKAEEKVAASRREAARTAAAWREDGGVPEECDEAWFKDEATAALTHFCFTCHVFLCPRHKGHNVEPINPIKDLYVETRVGALKKIGPVGSAGREEAMRANGIRPCSSQCHMASPADTGRNSPRANDPSTVAALWTKEERLLFRESVCVFKRDSCSIAKMIGPTKSCMDVYRYMHLPDISSIVNRIIVEAFRKRWPLEFNRGGQSAEAEAAMAGDAAGDGDGGGRGGRAGVGGGNGGGSGGVRRKDGLVGGGGGGGNSSGRDAMDDVGMSGGGKGGMRGSGRSSHVRPKRGVGAQGRARRSTGNITPAKKKKSRSFANDGGCCGGGGGSGECGHNGGGRSAGSGVGRSVDGDSGDGSSDDEDYVDLSQEADFKPCAHPGPCDKAACSCFEKGLKCEATCGCNTGRWTPRGYESPGPKGITDKKRICSLRHWGCACKPELGEHCNTMKCPCWAERRSCDPDFCDHCEASILPSQIKFDSRNCRNVGVLTGRHKRTVIGQSSVHGFGLFAGEVFEVGDLIGIYGGGIMDSKKADRIGHLYDAKDHTFFFDVTQSLVVDGGMLGMKVKYVNHTHDELKENAVSRCVRVRGVAHIGLFAKRRVEVGEEFMFNYKFTTVVPEWAKTGDSTSLSPDTPGRNNPETPGSGRPGKRATSTGNLAPRNLGAEDFTEVYNLDEDE